MSDDGVFWTNLKENKDISSQNIQAIYKYDS